MAFKRLIELRIGDSEKSFLISSLDVSFTVDRSIKPENNTAKIKVYNPSEDTTSQILKEGSSVTLKAGYEDEGTGLIYIGQITQSIPDTTGPDHFVELECGSKQGVGADSQSVIVTLGYKPGTAVSQVVTELATSLSLGVYNIDIIAGLSLPNGYTLAGNAKEALNYLQGILQRNDYGMFIDNTTLTLFRVGEGDTKVRAVYLSMDTGLMEAPKLTDNLAESKEGGLSKRLVFKSILNYKVKPYKMIQVDYPGVTGEFIIEKCTFTGDNFGGDFYVTGEGIAS